MGSVDNQERLIAPQAQEKDESSSGNLLRPQRLVDFVGQEKIKSRLDLFVKAAKQREEALDHVLLVGPPGLGKTTLAGIIAHEMGAQIHMLTGPNIEKKGDLAAVLTQLQPGDILFIDEIHRLQKTIEEVLYGAMEDYRLDLVIGQGPSARTLSLDLPKFTLVGATTRSGLLSGPLRDRFGIHLRLDFYPAEELQEVVSRSAGLLSFELDHLAAQEVARRSRGTPRIANRLLKRVRDYVQVKGKKGAVVSAQLAAEALDLFEVDHRGLDAMDRKLLTLLVEKFNGGPVGIETLSSITGEERDTLEEVVEPYLLQQGFLQRTPRGRVAAPLAYSHLEIPLKESFNEPEIGVETSLS